MSPHFPILFYSFSLALLSSLFLFAFCTEREQAARLCIHCPSLIFASEPETTETTIATHTHTQKRVNVLCVCVCAREPTSVLIPFAILAFSFQLNNLKGLFGAFALLFSHFHGLILSIAGWNHCSRCYSCIVLLFCFCFCKRCRQWNV